MRHATPPRLGLIPSEASAARISYLIALTSAAVFGS